MNNGDMSAMPTTAQCERCNSTHYKDEQTAGLTKREHFAGLAMLATLSNANTMDCIASNETTVAEQAVICADALLAELDKN
jgi:hypothetical protein